MKTAYFRGELWIPYDEDAETVADMSDFDGDGLGYDGWFNLSFSIEGTGTMMNQVRLSGSYSHDSDEPPSDSTVMDAVRTSIDESTGVSADFQWFNLDTDEWDEDEGHEEDSEDVSSDAPTYAITLTFLVMNKKDAARLRQMKHLSFTWENKYDLRLVDVHPERGWTQFMYEGTGTKTSTRLDPWADLDDWLGEEHGFAPLTNGSFRAELVRQNPRRKARRSRTRRRR